MQRMKLGRKHGKRKKATGHSESNIAGGRSMLMGSTDCTQAPNKTWNDFLFANLQPTKRSFNAPGLLRTGHIQGNE